MTSSLPTLHSTLVGDEGPVVVFCHGLFGRGRNFSGIAKALQPGYRSLLVDLPDHGGSGWTEGVDYGLMAAALGQHLRDTVGADLPIRLVGHSMGGKVAMMLALTEPDLVAQLVVVDISPSGSGEVGEFAHLLDALADLDIDSFTNLGDADRALAPEVPRPVLRGFLLQNLRHDREHARFVWQPNLEVLRRDLSVITDDIPHGDRSYDGPVLWVAGADSDYVQEEDGAVMRRLFPRTQLLRVKGAGHWVHSEQPEVFTAALRHVLDRAGQDSADSAAG